MVLNLTVSLILKYFSSFFKVCILNIKVHDTESPEWDWENSGMDTWEKSFDEI